MSISLTLVRPAAVTAITSDEFNTANLNTGLWTYTDPLGDTVQTLSGTQLSLAIPAGDDHDIQDTNNGGNNAPRITQAADDADFQVVAKFDSVPGESFEQVGIIVEQTPTLFLRLEVFFFGPGDVRLYATVIDGANRNDRGLVSNLTVGTAVYMRVTRAGGGGWTVEYSTDGVTYDPTESLTFNTAFSVTRVGVYGANSSGDGSSAPSFTALVDYFRNTASGIDSDGDGVTDDQDNCPDNANAGQEDVDGDGLGDACDGCPNDVNKTAPGACGCGEADIDSDADGALDCNEECDNDPNKTAPGACGCGVAETDTDSDGTPDCTDECDNDPNKAAAGACGCGIAETDTDSDGTPDCTDECDNDPNKSAAGACGCGVAETDGDADGTPDCTDACPADASNDADGDGVCGDVDNCPDDANSDQADEDADGVGDSCDEDSGQPVPGTDCGACGPISGMMLFMAAFGMWLMRIRLARRGAA